MKILDALKSLYARLREAFPPNRVVALLTAPAAALGGFVATWVASHFPGLPALDPTLITAIFISGVSAVVAAAYKWLDGWQHFEDHVHDSIENDRFTTQAQAGTSGAVVRRVRSK